MAKAFANISYNLQEIKRLTELVITKNQHNLLPNQLKLFPIFVKQFYLCLATEKFVDKLDYQIVVKAFNLFKFLIERSTNPKIRIYTPDENLDGWSSRCSVIEIICTDSPFIVDSIKEELTKKDIRIHQMSHPVIKVERQNQILSKIFSSTADTPDDFITESVIQLHISTINNSLFIKELIKDLTNILVNISLAVGDWQNILIKLQNINFNSQEQQEIKEFLLWLNNDNFTFLGFAECQFEANQVRTKFINKLGILQTTEFSFNQEINDELIKVINNIKKKEYLKNTINIGKIDKISQIHRRANIDFICINEFNEEGEIIKSKVFIGLFTSVLYYQSVLLIPIIRKKVDNVIKNSGFNIKSYSGKELVSILESLPRDELFQMSVSELYETSIGIYQLLINPRQLRLFVRRDTFDNFLSCLIFLPREYFSTELSEKIQEILHSDLGGVIASKNIQVTNLPIAYLYTIINTKSKNISIRDVEIIEAKLRELIKAWSDELKNEFINQYDEYEGRILYNQYKNIYSTTYQEAFDPVVAVHDFSLIKRAIINEQVVFDLYKSPIDKNNLNLKIYSPNQKIILSEIMPILDNLGFKALNEATFLISLNKENKQLWLHDFQLIISGYETQTISELKDYEILESKEIKYYVEEALMMLWHHEMQNDALNKLILRAGLHWRQVVLIRALGRYIRQTNFIYSHDYVDDVLTKNPKLIKLMIELFYCYFEPKRKESKRQARANELFIQIDERLSKVLSSAEDLIIRRFIEVIKSLLRTNYFQKYENKFKDYISFKLDSKKVPELPLPRPYAEIFVYSPRVEGIHLRGGKVARGGLRWSDRSEDFRIEVLGLMKAQMTKNTVIVPVGSKGGFVIKQPITLLGREDYLKEGIACYEIFLSGLLDLTDNIVDNQIITPPDLVCYDDDDPYLVVAADKGTATFSDIANNVAKKYNFWLGDAFASGGSAGYDHKGMAITARGGWICVQRHFMEQGINIQEEDFTVVGIGDMSGDVFGNGMLLSKHIRLIAAFNHIHIFIDPNPNPQESFEERSRLFNLSNSSWLDYDQAVISEGGQVFDRKTKNLILNAQIRAVFKIEEETITPDELIKKILSLDVDLLWNGGIGTYVKAISESNQQVGDKTNDSLRINGSDLRCKVVGEGGNLGFTQLGRIEYANNGGRINTDYIDNSAGVDCSDHEVNIKIALKQAIDNNQLTLGARNKLLEKMTDEVAQLVLRDNKLQAQAITIAQLQGYQILEVNSRLINKLEAMKELNREIEFLPSKQEIIRRQVAKIGMTRPEIAVLLAYSKLTIYNDLIKTELANDDYFQEDLLLYFPKLMRKEFIAEILNHPLRKEIITTSITNSMVNRIGTFFYHFALEDTGLKGNDIAKSYTITRDAFGLREIWAAIEDLDGKIAVNNQLELFLQVNKLVQRCTFWFLRNLTKSINTIAEIINIYQPAIKELDNQIDKLIVGMTKEDFQKKLELYNSMNIPKKLARKIASLGALSSAGDIILVASQNNLSINIVAKVYFTLGERLQLDWLRYCIDNITINNYWERLSIKSLKDDLYDQQRVLTAQIVKFMKQDNDPIAQWSKKNQQQINRYDDFINDLLSHESIDTSMLIVATKRVSFLISST